MLLLREFYGELLEKYRFCLMFICAFLKQISSSQERISETYLGFIKHL